MQRTSAGLGRHCFASDDWFQPGLLCGLFAAPSGFHNSSLSFQTTISNLEAIRLRLTEELWQWRLFLFFLVVTLRKCNLYARNPFKFVLILALDSQNSGELKRRMRTFTQAGEELCAVRATQGLRLENVVAVLTSIGRLPERDSHSSSIPTRSSQTQGVPEYSRHLP